VRLALLLSLSLALLLPGMRAVHADGFTPAQRDEIVRIMRDALKSDPSILRDAVAALQADEAQGQDRAAEAAVARLGDRLYDPADPIEGNPLGDVTVIEFYDTRCPYCRRMLSTFAELIRAEPNVKIELKDLPILGPESQLESRALLAAQRQGGYSSCATSSCTAARRTRATRCARSPTGSAWTAASCSETSTTRPSRADLKAMSRWRSRSASAARDDHRAAPHRRCSRSRRSAPLDRGGAAAPLTVNTRVIYVTSLPTVAL